MSVMDQLLAGAGDDGVTYAMATSLLGYTDGSLLDSVVDAFAAGDGAAAFEVVDRVIEGGNDPRRFVADLLERLRDLVILAAVPDAGEKGLIDAPADVVERMQAQASVFGAAELSRAADLVNEGLTEMRGATSPRLQVELICARVLLPAAFDDERSLQARLDRLERGASFAAAGPGPAVGYVPGPEAHGPGVGMPAGGVGGPAAARAAVRGEVPGGAPADAAPPVPVAAEPVAPPVAQQPQPAVEQAAPPAQEPPAPAGQRPGAWPAAAGAGSGGGEAARRPGGWPTASTPGSGVPQAPAPTPPPAPVRAAPAPAAAQAPAPGGQDMAQGAAQVRNMWPDILEAVKNRRRFTWILLSQNAQVTGFDGSTLQIGFLNAGARDTFSSSGSEEVLKQALAEQFNAKWRVDAVVDPSGGGGQPPQAGGGGGRPPAAPYQPPSAPSAPSYEPRPSAPVQQTPPPSPQPPPERSGRSEPSSYDRAAPEPPRNVAPEDDTAEADDPDLVDSALSGHDLIVRELGATVVEEFTNE